MCAVRKLRAAASVTTIAGPTITRSSFSEPEGYDEVSQLLHTPTCAEQSFLTTCFMFESRTGGYLGNHSIDAVVASESHSQYY